MAKQNDDDLRRDSNLGGDYARDTHQEGFGDDYAREDAAGAGTAARADTYGTSEQGGGVSRAETRKIGKASE